jgi:hypothetical protein
MQLDMSSTSKFQQVGTHRIPKALAQDPPFLFLVEAFDGRNQSAAESGQRNSTWANRQKFLDLVNRRIPASDIASLVSTINAAIFLFDKIPEISQEDYIFLAALLRFLKDYHLASEGAFESISQDIQARVTAKSGNFESFVYQWHKRTSEEAFDKELVHATETAERMQRNRKEAERRIEEGRERRKEVEEHREFERGRRHKLGPDLRNRSPVRLDLNRLVPEERSLVHAIHEEAWKARPINWLALGSEVFFNELTQRDYMDLADLLGEQKAEEEFDQGENFVTPPDSPMREE